VNFLGSNGNDFATSSGELSYMTRGGDDTILLTGGGRALAGAGNDFIHVSGESAVTGNDLVSGGAGDDFIVGSEFSDTIYGDNASIHVEVVPNVSAAVIDGFVYDVSRNARGDQEAHPNYIDLLRHSGSYMWDRMQTNYQHDYTLLIAQEGWYLPGGLPEALAYVQGVDPTFDDYIDAGEGDDVIYSGSGSDIVFGGDGDDTIYGDSGVHVTPEMLAAFGESIALLGAPGDDYIDGGAGDDLISDGSGGDDTLYGGDGDDTISSSEHGEDPSFEAYNRLDGGAGNDRIFALVASSGFDVVLGGEGDDQITVIGNAYVDGGTGNDVMRMNWGAVRDEGGFDTLNDGDLMLRPQLGIADEVESLMFDSETDVGRGHVEVSRSGDDLVYSVAVSAVDPMGGGDGIVEFDDELVFVDWFAGPDFRIERIGSLSADQFERWGSLQVGGANADDFVGREYVDRIAGSAGNDSIAAGAGDDLISGRGGDDYLDGGHGDDTYFYSAGFGRELIVDAGGDDALRFGQGIVAGDVSFAYEGASLVIHVAGGSVTLAGVGPGDIGGDLPVERLVFATGEMLEVASVAAGLPPPEGAPAQNPSPIAVVDFPPPDEVPAVPETPGAGAAAGFSGSMISPDEGPPGVLEPIRSSALATEIGPLSPDAPVTMAPQVRGPLPATLAYEAATTVVIADVPDPIGTPSDPVYREIDARLDVLLQAGRMNLSERYAEAIQEFERRRTGNGEDSPPPPASDDVAQWSERVHDWHARHPTFESGPTDAADGAWIAGWNGVAPGSQSLDELIGTGAVGSGANPNALGRIAGVRQAPGLSEGIAELRG